MLADLFTRHHEPLFLNEGTFQSELILQEMEALRPQVHQKDSARLDRDIKLQKAGIVGEKRVAFELKNSHYPLVFIHDLNLEHEGIKAQIDFLVISPYNAFIIECKNLIGNVEIDKDGSFVRAYGPGRSKLREGLYSPVTQNTRHIELMKAILREGRSTVLNALAEKLLEQYYHSFIVFTNDKTVISMAHAPQDVCRKIVRTDQLVSRIKQLDQALKKKHPKASFEEEKDEAEFWLSQNKPSEIDLSEKYQINGLTESMSSDSKSCSPQYVPSPQTQPPLCPLCGSPMVLRTARRGKRKGKQFWGCSNFSVTGCRGGIDID